VRHTISQYPNIQIYGYILKPSKAGIVQFIGVLALGPKTESVPWVGTECRGVWQETVASQCAPVPFAGLFEAQRVAIVMMGHVHDAFSRNGRFEHLVTPLAGCDQAFTCNNECLLVLSLNGTQGVLGVVDHSR
jgi:hypothetical protein